MSSLAERLFEAFGANEDAYNAACSHVRAGRLDEGVKWLEHSIDAGFRGRFTEDDDLKPLLGHPAIAALEARQQKAAQNNAS